MGSRGQRVKGQRSNDQRANGQQAGGQCVYELEVCIISGPMTEAFVEVNPVIARTIQIRGDQTLAKLHDAIFDAFGREEEHLYEFQLGGKGPNDPNARRYVLPIHDPFESRKPAGIVTQTAMDALGLEKDQAFGYWFDFGDDWWHQINVLAIHASPGDGKYPRVAAKIGENPPQYIDWDNEDDEDEEDDDETK